MTTQFDNLGSRLFTGLDGKIGIFNFQGADTDVNGTKRSCKNIITGQEENVNNFLLSPYLRKISTIRNNTQILYSDKEYILFKKPVDLPYFL